MPDIKPASTIVLVRDRESGLETLLLQRSSKLAFASGAWVFPGGRLDPGDYAGNPQDHLGAARRAAVRETQEETGLQITDRDMIHFAHWVTPPGSPRRFATWFFLAPYDGSDRVEVDGGEIHQHQWIRPDEALAAHRSGEIELMPPTFVTLGELSQCDSVGSAQSFYSDRGANEYILKIVNHNGENTSLFVEDAGYESGDINVEGRRHRIHMTRGNWRYERD